MAIYDMFVRGLAGNAFWVNRVIPTLAGAINFIRQLYPDQPTNSIMAAVNRLEMAGLAAGNMMNFGTTPGLGEIPKSPASPGGEGYRYGVNIHFDTIETDLAGNRIVTPGGQQRYIMSDVPLTLADLEQQAFDLFYQSLGFDTTDYLKGKNIDLPNIALDVVSIFYVDKTYASY